MNEQPNTFEENFGTGESGSTGSPPESSKRKKSAVGWTIILGIVLIIVVLVILDRVVGINIFTSEEQRQEEQVADFLEETGAWHAVFLTNGQVYFGQLSEPEAQYATLRDVYYLQLQQSVQPAGQAAAVPEGEESQVVPAPQPEPPRLTLIKFGTELHGPKDFMKINRDQILFWEELKNDSNVVNAIVNYKAGL